MATGGNNDGKNNNNEQQEEPGWEELEEIRAEWETPTLVPIEPLRFTRSSRDVVIQLTDREARDQNDRNRVYEELVTGGNTQGQRRLERSWHQRVERQRDSVARETARRTQDTREEQLEAAMARCQIPPTDKEEKK